MKDMKEYSISTTEMDLCARLCLYFLAEKVGEKIWEIDRIPDFASRSAAMIRAIASVEGMEEGESDDCYRAHDIVNLYN